MAMSLFLHDLMRLIDYNPRAYHDKASANKGTNLTRVRRDLNPRPQPAWLIKYLKSGAAKREPYCSNPPGPLWSRLHCVW
jgi:hypothetical protein